MKTDKDIYKNQRRSWGNVKPCTQIHKDKSKYSRKEKHKKGLLENMDKEFTATDIVKDLYNKFPEVDFYDERDLDDTYVGLIFDAKKVDQETLEKYIKRYNCWYKFKNGKLLIKAKEDYDLETNMDESMNKNLTEAIWDLGPASDYKGTYPHYDLDPYYNPDRWQGPYNYEVLSRSAQYLKDNVPDIDQYITKPSDEEIAHIVTAMKKVKDRDGDWGVRSKAGINVGAITDKEKFYHYLMIACALRFGGYIRKAAQVGFIPYNVMRSLGILLYDHPLTTYIKDKIPTIEQELADEAAKKAEKKAAREQKKAEQKAQAQADAGYTTGTIKNNRVFNLEPNVQDALTKLTEFSNDVNITGGSSTPITTPRGTTYTTYNITYNEGTPYEYKDTIQVKQIADGFTPIISGKEFKNLPARQFVGWMKRKLDQLRNDAANAPVVDASNDIDSVPDEYNDDEGSASSNESLNESSPQDLQEEKKILYVIKDKHGNQCSKPNEDDQELWDRIEGKPGYKVVVYTDKEEQLTESLLDVSANLLTDGEIQVFITSNGKEKHYKAKVTPGHEQEKVDYINNLPKTGKSIKLVTKEFELKPFDKDESLKESAERTDDLDTGIKDETETIDLYDDFMNKDCFDQTDKELIKGIRDDEKDHRKILRDMKAGKKNIKADESLKESDDEFYQVQYTNSDDEIFDGGTFDTFELAKESAIDCFHSDPDCEYFVIYDKNGDIIFTEEDLNESLKESVQPTNTKINIRESLNKIDWDTDNKYDLRNMYDASKMEYKDKIELAKKISLNESCENLYSYLKKFI